MGRARGPKSRKSELSPSDFGPVRLVRVRKPKTGGGKLSRSQVVTVRLDPRMRYLAELAARKDRRTLSAFIELAIEDRVRPLLPPVNRMQIGPKELWSPDPAERFARLAIQHPDLLTDEQQALWTAIKDSNLLWLGGDQLQGSWEWDWGRLERDVFPKLREHWNVFNRVALGETSPESAPKWPAYGGRDRAHRK